MDDEILALVNEDQVEAKADFMREKAIMRWS